MSFQIRAKAPADMRWIISYMKENWGSEKIVSRGRVHDVSELPGFIAIRDEQPAGIILYKVERNECEIVLLESFAQKIGIGSTLIEYVKREAATQGCQRLWLITTNDNLAAIRFYQLRGFVLVALHRDAIAQSRKLKPEIPLRGIDGIPIRDEIELEVVLK